MKPTPRRVGTALCVVVAAVSAASCGQPQSDAALFASAQGFLQKREYKAATIQIKNLLQRNPESAEAHFLLGRTLFETGDATGAETEMSRAIRQGHPPSAAVPLMARILEARQDHQAITDRYANVSLDDKAADAELQSTVALAFSVQQKPTLARAAIDKARASDPRSAGVDLADARILAASADFDAALSRLADLLARDPSNLAAWQLKGLLLLHGKRDLPGAVAADTQALGLRPNDAPLQATLISLHLAQGDRDQAVRQLAALQSTRPQDPLTLYCSAAVLFAQGDFAGAAKSAQSLLRLDPTNAAALRIAGAVELGSGSFAQATDDLSESLRLQPRSTDTRALLAEAYLRADRPARAIQVVHTLVDRPGADARLLLLAGQAYLLLDDVKAADSVFKRVSASESADESTRMLRALTQVAQGDAQAGLAALQSVAASGSDPNSDLVLVAARMRRGEYAAALNAVDALEKKQPAGSPLAADLRGRIHLLRHDLPAARRSFEQAVQSRPGYGFAVVKLGAIDLLEHQPAAAEARLRHLVERDPKNVDGWLALADLKRRGGGSPEDVVRLLVQATEAAPSDDAPRIALIDFHAARGDADAAALAAQAAVAALPRSAELLDRLARTALARHEIDTATRAFKTITAEAPESPLGFQGLAEIAIARKDHEAAAREARRALDVAPRSLAARQVAIIAAMNLRRPDDALRHARLIQDQHPDDAVGYIWEGDLHAAARHWAPAESALRKALTKPQPAQAAMKLHSVLLADNKRSDASNLVTRWTAAHPDDLVFLAYLAESATRRDDFVAAEDMYRRVLSRQPRNALALNNLAWLFIRQERAGGVALATRALESAPDQIEMMDTLAMAYSVDKQHAKAVDLQTRVLALSPDVPAFRLTMAKIHLRAGDKALAKAELEALATLDFAGSKEAAALLRSLG